MKRPLLRWNGLARFFPDFLGRGESPSALATISEQSPMGSEGARVLIIDDDEVMLAATSMRLSKAGCSVEVARDGSEAISVIGRQSPDFILVDINFPPDVSSGGMVCWDGFRIMFWLRGLENTQGAQFIITTGYPFPGCAERALAAGAIGFFPKPIDHTKLLELIQAKRDAGRKIPANSCCAGDAR